MNFNFKANIANTFRFRTLGDELGGALLGVLGYLVLPSLARATGGWGVGMGLAATTLIGGIAMNWSALRVAGYTMALGQLAYTEGHDIIASLTGGNGPWRYDYETTAMADDMQPGAQILATPQGNVIGYPTDYPQLPQETSSTTALNDSPFVATTTDENPWT